MQDTIILKDGSLIPLNEWKKTQSIHSFSPDQLSNNFTSREMRCKGTGEFLVSEILIMLLQEIRDLWGKPIRLSCVYRSPAHNKAVGGAKNSPHPEGMAADIDLNTQIECQLMVEIIKKASRETGIKIRIGYKQYLIEGKTFVHVDVLPQYYAPGQPLSGKQKHPAWTLAGLEW